MDDVTIDFNSRGVDGVVAVKAERLTGAHRGDVVNVVDPDGGLAALAVVREMRERIVLLRVLPSSIKDVTMPGMGPISG